MTLAGVAPRSGARLIGWGPDVTRRPVLPARVTARAARAGARWAVLAVLAGVTLAHALPVTPGGIGITQVGAALPLTAS